MTPVCFVACCFTIQSRSGDRRAPLRFARARRRENKLRAAEGRALNNSRGRILRIVEARFSGVRAGCARRPLSDRAQRSRPFAPPIVPLSVLPRLRFRFPPIYTRRSASLLSPSTVVNVTL